MKLYDLHQDLMTHLRFREQLGQNEQTSFELIEQSPIDLVVATAFPFPDSGNQADLAVNDLITEELELYQAEVERRDWKLIESSSDLELSKQKIILHIEGLNAFDGSVLAWQRLEKWQQLGVRSVGTHWNIDNSLGGGTNSPALGLTKLGTEVFSWLEAESMVVDLAHMSRQGFFDAARIATKPLYVSHGNADVVCSSMRNYTDEQLRMIGESGGVIGIFFAGTFVAGKNNTATFSDVMQHVKHVIDVAGEDAVAIGSDFGGIVSGGVVGLESALDLFMLEAELCQSGLTVSQVEKVFNKNAVRVLREHLL